MSARTRPMSALATAARAGHARAFIAAADLVQDLGADAGIESRSNLIGSLAVLAGIPAADAICGSALGECAYGENHLDAVALLKRATPPGDSSSTRLKRLLDAKTTTQYSPLLLGARRASDLLTAARRLVETMESSLQLQR